jgi:GWxTD domain-containing protein
MLRRHLLFLLAAAVFTTVSAHGILAQGRAGSDAKTVQNVRIQPFFFDILNFAEYDDFGLKGRVDVYVHVPNDLLTFVKNQEFYVSGYTITVLVYEPDNTRLVREETWERKVELLSFERTTSAAHYDLSQRTLKIDPGTYQIEVLFEDRESRKEFRQSRSFTVQRYDQNLLGISDLMLVRNVENVGIKRQISPQINPNVAALENGFEVFYEVYNPFKLNAVDITYSITRQGREMFTKRDTQPLKQGTNTFLANIASSGLGIGSYILKATIRRSDDSAGKNELATVERQFIIEWLTAGAPISAVDLDAAIDQLRYYATSEELRSIRDAADDQEKRRRFEAFWERRNPAPGSKTNTAMIEYYNRVAYANQQFGHFLDGWKTDRGMTYIMYGAPDYIDRNPLSADERPYEIWEYYDINRRFVFVDESGFGDYRLLYPIWDDRNRLR